MVIVKLEKCIKQLNNEIKDQIIQKQTELLNDDEMLTLEERLENPQFRIKLLEHLTYIEKKYFIIFIKKFGLYDEGIKEEQIISTEEKLALLLLQQKGLIFQVKKHNQNTSYVIPIEVIESFLLLQLQKKEIDIPKNEHRPQKRYIYYLTELMMFIKNNKKFTKAQFNKFNENLAPNVNLQPLLKYLQTEGAVSDQFLVSNENTEKLFKRNNHDLKQSLALFLLNHHLKDRFSILVVVTLLLRSQRPISINQLADFIMKYIPINKTLLNEAINVLVSFEIISRVNDCLFQINDEIDSVHVHKGLSIGLNEILVPVYIRNDLLWNLRMWGHFSNWEEMVHISFQQETVINAFKMNGCMQQLFNCLNLILQKNEANDLFGTIETWIDRNRPVIKKQALTFYTITEKLHLKFIEEHWPHWWDQANSGIIINEDMAFEFESMIRKISVEIIDEKNKTACIISENNKFNIISKYPVVTKEIPEIVNIPKQWFRLTTYDEKTLNRIIKQAIVLNLPVQLQFSNEEIIMFYPKKVTIEQGLYFVYSQENIKYSFSCVSKASIVNPINL